MAYQSGSRRGGSRRPSGGSSRSSGSRSSGSRSSGSRSSGSRSSGSRSSGSGSRGGGSRGRSRGGRGGGGGGSNATAIGVTIVVLVGAVIVFVVMSGKKKRPVERGDRGTELTSESVVDKGAEAAKKPERPPPPPISQEIIDHAKEVVLEAAEEKAKADALYEEAMAAKASGDEKKWQAKLDEARGHYILIKEMWNEKIVADIVGELPADCQWDADEVANYYVGKQAGKITKALERLAYITKQMRMK